MTRSRRRLPSRMARGGVVDRTCRLKTAALVTVAVAAVAGTRTMTVEGTSSVTVRSLDATLVV